MSYHSTSPSTNFYTPINDQLQGEHILARGWPEERATRFVSSVKVREQSQSSEDHGQISLIAPPDLLLCNVRMNPGYLPFGLVQHDRRCGMERKG